MSGDDRATIEVSARDSRGSREGRRLRKQGQVPGILYGRGREPQAFSVNELELRAAMKAGHALLDVKLGSDTVPVIVKDQQHHPVRGGFTHLDLLEVDLKQSIQSVVPLELAGVEEAPGVVQGGVLDHVTRELNIEALPTDIPDSVVIDVSGLELNATFMLSEATIPSNLTVLDDPEETVIATITPPSKAEAPETVEEETELVGEGEEAAEGEAAGEASEGGDEGGE
ncbi:MAG: 50S ribosomal protein L25 [Solirubrobacterales bacterium]